MSGDGQTGYVPLTGTESDLGPRSISLQQPFGRNYVRGQDGRQTSTNSTHARANEARARIREAVKRRSRSRVKETRWLPYEHTMTPGWLRMRWVMLWPLQVGAPARVRCWMPPSWPRERAACLHEALRWRSCAHVLPWLQLLRKWLCCPVPDEHTRRGGHWPPPPR